jgi:hypothetical protein
MEMDMYSIIEDLLDGMAVGFLVCVIVGLAIAFGG